jgi:hypothetical protein
MNAGAGRTPAAVSSSRVLFFGLTPCDPNRQPDIVKNLLYRPGVLNRRLIPQREFDEMWEAFMTAARRELGLPPAGPTADGHDRAL